MPPRPAPRHTPGKERPLPAALAAHAWGHAQDDTRKLYMEALQLIVAVVLLELHGRHFFLPELSQPHDVGLAIV